MFNILVGLFMFAALAGMIFCAKKQDVNPIAKPAAIGLLVVVILCAFLMIYHGGSGDDGSDIILDEMKFIRAGAKVMGEKLAGKMPGAKVLIVADWKSDRPNSARENIIEGLKEGFGDTITDVKIESPVPQPSADPDAEGYRGLDEIMTAKDFNKMLAKNKDRTLVIITTGFPEDIGEMNIWEQFEKDPAKTPKLAVFRGAISKMKTLFESGLIILAVDSKPGADYEQPPKGDTQEIFNQRFILITKDNLNDIISKYPGKVFKSK